MGSASGGSRRENLGCNAVSTKASGEPTGSSEATTVPLSCLTLKQRPLYAQLPSHWIQAAQVRGFDLVEAASFRQEQFSEGTLLTRLSNSTSSFWKETSGRTNTSVLKGREVCLGGSTPAHPQC